MTRSPRPRTPAPPRSGSPAARALLAVGPDDRDDGDLLAGLQRLPDVRVRRVESAAAAAAALAERSVDLLVASPGLATAAVTELLAARGRLAPALPVLIVRDRQAEAPAAWVGAGVGLLRAPLLPGALERSVAVVLGLAAGGREPRA